MAVLVRQAAGDTDLAEVRALCREYRDFLLDRSPQFRDVIETFYGEPGYSTLLARLDKVHARPEGCILLAETAGRVIGCGMSHEVLPGASEIKRVYVRPDGRGPGAGRAICAGLIAQARDDGYARVLLDTGHTLREAIRLYEALGFRRRDAYQPMPEIAAPILRFYELTL